VVCGRDPGDIDTLSGSTPEQCGCVDSVPRASVGVVVEGRAVAFDRPLQRLRVSSGRIDVHLLVGATQQPARFSATALIGCLAEHSVEHLRRRGRETAIDQCLSIFASDLGRTLSRLEERFRYGGHLYEEAFATEKPENYSRLAYRIRLTLGAQVADHPVA
jgi:hypothetical protein